MGRENLSFWKKLLRFFCFWKWRIIILPQTGEVWEDFRDLIKFIKRHKDDPEYQNVNGSFKRLTLFCCCAPCKVGPEFGEQENDAT